MISLKKAEAVSTRRSTYVRKNLSDLSKSLDKIDILDRIQKMNTENLSKAQVESVIKSWSKVFFSCVLLQEAMDSKDVDLIASSEVESLKKTAQKKITFYSDLLTLMRVPVQIEAPF